jgi:hypothetical protein
MQESSMNLHQVSRIDNNMSKSASRAPHCCRRQLFALGKLPKPSQPPAVGRASPEQNLAPLFNREYVLLAPLRDRTRATDRQLIFNTQLARLTVPPDWAMAAQRLPGHAHGSAQLHQRLIELTRAQAVQQSIGERCQPPSHHLRFNISRLGRHAAQHPQNISIQRGMRFPKRDAGYRRGRVIADAGQLPQPRIIAGKPRQLEDPARGLL